MFIPSGKVLYIKMPKYLFFILILLLTSWTLAQSSLTGQVIDISPGFEPDPLSFEYISGGPINVETEIGNDVNGNECKGFIASEPDHTLVLRSDFANLRIFVEAARSEDTTMIIRSEDASLTLCHDDVSRDNPHPSIARAFTTGIYYIYIGSFDERKMSNYTIVISE